MQEAHFQSRGWEDPLEEEMATHSSILAWRIPMDRGAWQATVLGVTELDMTWWLNNNNMKPPSTMPYRLKEKCKKQKLWVKFHSWLLLRTIAQETASQLALRNCSEKVYGQATQEGCSYALCTSPPPHLLLDQCLLHLYPTHMTELPTYLSQAPANDCSQQLMKGAVKGITPCRFPW